MFDHTDCPRRRPPRRAGRRARSRLALVLLAGAATGAALPATACYRSAKGGGAPEAQQATTVRVRNQNFLDMNIYVVRGGIRSRLGTATGNSTVTFRIPPSFVQVLTVLRFQADPIGGRGAPVTEEITVSPGDEVTLMIPPG